MILPLLTSFIAINLMKAKHFLVETENNAVRPVLPIEAKEYEEYEDKEENQTRGNGWEILVS